MAFRDESVETLLKIRSNLLEGLTKVGEHVVAGTAHVAAPGKVTPPIQFGQIGKIFLELIDAELERRRNEERLATRH